MGKDSLKMQLYIIAFLFNASHSKKYIFNKVSRKKA